METVDVTPLHIETLNGGLARGVPSVGLIIELPPERRAAVLAQTSVNVFQLVAGATYVRYGDMTGGGRVGLISENRAAPTFSPAVGYPNCVREIPGSAALLSRVWHTALGVQPQ